MGTRRSGDSAGVDEATPVADRGRVPPPGSGTSGASAVWRRSNRRSPGGGGVRIALYSHDTLGLGHTRRNLAIAHELTRLDIQVDILLITGSRASARFALPPGADCLTLPSLRKDLDGSYHARSLDLSLGELSTLRAETIWAALKAFKPDLFIVDNVPRGAAGELDTALRKLRKRGTTRCVLGLRDILDEPGAVQRQWRDQRNDRTIRKFYDAVWIYGDSALLDPREAYGFSAKTSAKVSFLGYLDPRNRLRTDRAPSKETSEALAWATGRSLLLCQAGGGQDGFRLAEAFAAAPLPDRSCALLLTGPFMPPEGIASLRRSASTRADLKVLDFHPEPIEILPHAERVVSMAGYNTLLEAAVFARASLTVPRVAPRLEQWIRAERFSERGLTRLLHPADLDPAALGAWFAQPQPAQGARRLPDLGAAHRLLGRIEALLGRPLPSRRRAPADPQPGPQPDPQTRPQAKPQAGLSADRATASGAPPGTAEEADRAAA